MAIASETYSPTLDQSALLDELGLRKLFERLAASPCTVAEIAQSIDLPLDQVDLCLRAFLNQGVVEGQTADTNDAIRYALSGELQLLDASTIKSHMSTRSRNIMQSIDLHRVVGSTNDELLKSELAVGAATLCITEMQVAGRGRRGNAWQAGAFKNITMSLAYKMPDWPNSTPSFALAAAVAVATVINQNFGLSTQIKWPNDILLERAKLGGLLVEASGSYGNECTLIVGLGLNLDQVDESRSAGSDYAWTSLSEHVGKVDRNQLVADLVDSLLDCLRIFEQEGFAPFQQHWQTLSAFNKQAVSVKGQDIDFAGVQKGVNEQGALLVEDAAGAMHTVDDLAISVRLLEGAG